MEVNINFPDAIDLKLPKGEMVELKVEYSWRPLMCYSCEKIRPCKRGMHDSHLETRKGFNEKRGCQYK